MDHRESSHSADLSNYSDDFEEDELVDTSAKVLLSNAEGTPKHAKPNSILVSKTDPIQRKAKKQFNSTTVNVSRVKGKDGFLLSEGITEKRPSPQKILFSPRDKAISAKQHTIDKLNNKLSDSERQMAETRKENKLLNRLIVKQEKELSRVQTDQGELPQILTRHAEEVRIMKEHLKHSRKSNSSYQNKILTLQSEIQKLTDYKVKLEHVVKRKHLLERESLTLQLQEATDNLQSKDTKIKELEKEKEAMIKTHSQQEKTLKHKNKVLIQEAKQATTMAYKTKAQLKDRNREMDIINIYSREINKDIPHNFIYQHTPIMENKKSQTYISCPPNKTVSMQTKQCLISSSSQTPVEPVKTFKTSTTQTEINFNVAKPSPYADVTKPSPNIDVAKPSPQKETVSVFNEAPFSPQNTTHSTLDHFAVPTQPNLKNSSDHVTSVQVPITEEQQKKDILLAKLRALDSLKAPPASQPITSITAKRSVEDTTHHGIEITTQQAKLPPPVNPVQDEEAQKKKLLLAKLLAIDIGANPKETVSKMDVPEPVTDTVDNMHKGKPAYTSEDDPFGSRHTSGKRLGGRLHSKSNKMTTKLETGSKQSPGQLKTAAMNSKGIIPKPAQGFKPTFGRRAHAAETNTDISRPFLNSDKNSIRTKEKDLSVFGFGLDHGQPSKKDYPWEIPVNLESHSDNHREPPDRSSSSFREQGENSMVFVPKSSSSLLPFRAKAEANVIPGVVSEPNDLEELIL